MSSILRSSVLWTLARRPNTQPVMKTLPIFARSNYGYSNSNPNRNEATSNRNSSGNYSSSSQRNPNQSIPNSSSNPNRYTNYNYSSSSQRSPNQNASSSNTDQNSHGTGERCSQCGYQSNNGQTNSSGPSQNGEEDVEVTILSKSEILMFFVTFVAFVVVFTLAIEVGMTMILRVYGESIERLGSWLSGEGIKSNLDSENSRTNITTHNPDGSMTITTITIKNGKQLKTVTTTRRDGEMSRTFTTTDNHEGKE